MVIGRILLAFTLIASITSNSFANPAHSQLLSLSESQRKAIFAKYLSSSGEKCGSVTQTFFQGLDHDDRAYWNARCANGNTYMIQVDDDAGGSTKIMDCSLMAALGTPCFTKW